MAATRDIAEILIKRDPIKYKNIIERAANNGYHDFKHDTIPGHPEYADAISPKMQLVVDLSEFPELNDISDQVKNGVYDESPDEIDDINTRLILLNENCPDVMFKVFGHAIPTEQERKNHQNNIPLN